MSSHVEYSSVDGVATIRLNRLDKRNALTLDMANEIGECISAAENDSTVGCLVVCGGETAFCAGADLSVLTEAREDPFGETSFNTIGTLYATFARLASCGIPTIAAVRGYAIGGGLNLALSADLRIVAHDAVLRSGFMRMGVHPGGGHSNLLMRAGGFEFAVATGLFDEDLSGSDAAKRGIAWRAVSSSDVESVAYEYASRLANKPELARHAIRLLRMSATTGASLEVVGQMERLNQLWSYKATATR